MLGQKQNKKNRGRLMKRKNFNPHDNLIHIEHFMNIKVWKETWELAKQTNKRAFSKVLVSDFGNVEFFPEMWPKK